MRRAASRGRGGGRAREASSLLHERADQEVENGAARGGRVVGLRRGIPVPVDGPEHERLEHEARRGGGVLEAPEAAAARAIVEVAGEEGERAFAPGAIPELREVGVV